MTFSFKSRRYRFLLILMISILVFLFYPISESTYSYSTVLNDRNGNLLGATIAEDGQWRFPEPDSINYKISTCIRFFEDRHFYKHPGINPLSVGRATFQNIKAGAVVSGASTLTMQIARMMRKKDRTFWNKLVEMGMALKLEIKYSKKELMKKYLSMAPFGGNVVGIDAASWRYFNRPSHLLSWGEAASLAVLPNNPGAIFPGRSKAQYLKKRNQLLKTLLSYEVIDSSTFDLSIIEELPGKPYPIPEKATHLLTTISEKKAGEITKVSIDPFWQLRTSEIIERHHEQQETNGVENICAMVVDLETSKVLAYIGNTKDTNSGGQQVDVIQKPRSPGSSLKPLLYAFALDKGEILPKTLLPDVPTFFGGFSPKNFSGGYEGAVPADQALAKSLNIPFTYLLQDHTYEQFNHDLQKIGFGTLNQSPGHYGLSIILGGAEIKMWDLVNAYSKLFQSLATREEADITYLNNITLKQKSKLDPAAIWYTFQAMTKLSRPDGEDQWKSFSSTQLISWKTGTSFGFRDAWAIGLNGKILAAVWVGNADGEGRAGLTGINAAAPPFLEIMRLSDHDRNWLKKLKPPMIQKEVCIKSGMLTNEPCPSELMEVPKLAENSGICPYHKEFWMDETMSYQVNSSCYTLAEAKKETHFVLPATMGYYYSKTHPEYRGIPQLYNNCSVNASNPIQIIYPNYKSKVFLPITLDGQKGKMVLEASHQNSNATLFWSIGNQFFGKTRKDHRLEVFLPKGNHVLTVTDNYGNERIQTFEVISDPQ